MNLEDAGLQDLLEQWQFYCNWQRIYDSLGKTPMEWCCELFNKTPLSEEVYALFDEDREREIQRIRKLKCHRRN